MSESAEGRMQSADRFALRSLVCALFAILVYGCATTTPPVPAPTEEFHGVASWYGEEFAGRTTANGEIFDPLLLTAAHRTLPFGTVLDITNPKTRQTVRVRVNDRGPYIGNRVIDLSYAAAQQIGLVDPGVGEVDIKLVRIGSGEREAPAPMEVTIAEAPKSVTPVAASEPPKVDFPIPQQQQPMVVDRVVVEEQHAGVVTRRQVAENGTTITNVPVATVPAPPVPAAPLRRSTAAQFVVQVGAFAVEANAKLLQNRLSAIGQSAWIDRNDLFRVRIGPFATRELAVRARAALEANGISAIILRE